MNVAHVKTCVALHCKHDNKTIEINSIFTYLKQRDTANATQKCKLVARSEILLCNLLTIQLTVWQQYSCSAARLTANYHANVLLCLIPELPTAENVPFHAVSDVSIPFPTFRRLSSPLLPPSQLSQFLMFWERWTTGSGQVSGSKTSNSGRVTGQKFRRGSVCERKMSSD